MRFLYLLVCILLYVGNSFAQTSTTMPSPHHPEFNDYYLNPENRATITGKVLNLPDSVDREKLIGYAAVALHQDDQKELSTVINPDGTFTIELPFSVPVQEVWFWLGEKFYTALIVKSGLHIEMDYAALAASGSNYWTHPSVTFSGPDEVLTDVRGKQIATSKETGLEFIPIMMERGLSSKQKITKLDSVLALLQASDEDLLQGRNEQASIIIHNERLTEYLSLLNVVFWNEPMPEKLLERYLAHSPVIVSNRSRDFYKYFTASQLAATKRTVMDQLQITHLEATANPVTTNRFLEKVDSTYSPARADLMKLYLEHDDPLINMTMMEAAVASMTVPWCKASSNARLEIQRQEVNQLNESLAGKIEIISPKELGESLGYLDFGAKLYGANATSGQALLDQLRGVFHDKAIYLDLWAVWCGPCIQELPFSKKAHEAAGALPIEFVYLCTESGGNEEQWQNLIAGHQVPGTHLFVPEAPHNELLKLLLGRGYPTYVLIKPDGTVVHDVPRPSELDREKLERLLGGE